MFIILTHDNQSTLSSFNLFLSLWQIVPWLKKPTLVPVMYAWLSLKHVTVFKIIWHLFCSPKKTHFLFHNLWSDLFLRQDIFVVFTLMDCALISNGWSNFWCLNRLFLYNGVQTALCCWLSLIVKGVSEFLLMCMIKNLLKLAFKVNSNILHKVIANWKGTNRFSKESRLVYELTHNTS